MKPNFALGLTDDGITLWQRGRSGWLRVGAVDPDSPERDTQLDGLVSIAHALAPEGVTTKLVIPDEQILFCDLEVASRNRDAQVDEIRSQLHGLTPYPVEELDFDWTINGSQMHVAVVARETLVEAEDFAQALGLNPVSAVAAPAGSPFNREPFFGPTRQARSIVGDPDLIEREPEIIRETGTARLPEPELAAEPETTDELPSKEAPAETPPAPQEPVAQPEADEEQPAAAEPATSTTEGAKAGKPTSDKPDGESKTPAAAPTERADDPEKKAEKPTAGSGKTPDAPTTAKPDTSKTDKPSSASPTGGKKFTDVLKTRGITAGSYAKTPRATQPPASPPKNTPPLTFASRRAPTGRVASDPGAPRGPLAKPADTAQETGVIGGLRARLTSSAALTNRSATVARKLRDSLAELKPKAMGQVQKATSAITAARPKKPALTEWSKERADTQDDDKTGTEHPSGTAAPAEPTGRAASPRRDPLETLRDHAASPGSQSEAERLTIFGARHQTVAEPSRLHRGVLVLGGVGLLLVAVAIWVFFFTTTQPPAPQTAVLPDESDILAPEAVSPTDSALLPEDSLTSEEIEAALGLEDAAQQPPMEMGEPEMLAQPDEIEPSQQAQPAAPTDTNAGRVAGLRSVSLIAPEETVALPLPPSAPAPFGSEPLPPLREELAAAAAADEVTDVPTEGLPSALPAGEELLEITVTEGVPPAVPPARPAGIAPEPLVEPEVAAEPSPESTPEPDTAADAAPDMAAAVADALDEAMLDISVTEGQPAAVPPQRPEGLAPELEAPPDPAPAPEPAAEDAPDAAPEDAQGQDEAIDPDQASLTSPPPGGVALTGIRPAARPEQIVLAALAPEPEPVPGVEDASSLAVASSQRPGTRPSQFSVIVQRALRNNQTRSSTPPASVQSSEPVQTARAAAAAPVIPTSASVAREATQRQAINLRQVNLIGVMGTSNNRRALVRLSNGRVVTVRVGENLDGGQVTAIGADELRYTRRGRNVVLRIAS
ncbi:MAG: hypothetical protein EA407_12915 [Rhodobacteraceae bacterium]|nr:MAG: hypothetical protein EA407_12915 [Paracoccaceae bacterium]